SEPVSDLDVTGAPIVGTTVEPNEVPLAIDELPLVALLGCFAEGETVVRGAGELRVKESDRITSVVEGLRGLGADIEAAPDGFVVRGAGSLRGGRLDAGGGHRLALLGAVAGPAPPPGAGGGGAGLAAGRRGRGHGRGRRLLSQLRARHRGTGALDGHRDRRSRGGRQVERGARSGRAPRLHVSRLWCHVPLRRAGRPRTRAR